MRTARRVNVNASKPLTAPQDAARRKLGLEFAIDYKWYRVIEKTGTGGAQWGGLPMHVTKRLTEKGLIVTIGRTTWTRGNFDAVIEQMSEGGEAP